MEISNLPTAFRTTSPDQTSGPAFQLTPATSTSGEAATRVQPQSVGPLASGRSRAECLQDIQFCADSVNGLLILVGDPDVQRELVSPDPRVREAAQRTIKEQVSDVRQDVRQTLADCRSVLNAKEISKLEKMIDELDQIERGMARFDGPDREGALDWLKRGARGAAENLANVGNALMGGAAAAGGALLKMIQLMQRLAH